MSKSTMHAYEVIENTANNNVSVGGFLIDRDHVRREHEPRRTWQFMDLDTGNITYTVGIHVGEYEKLKKYIHGYRDSRIMRPVVEFYRDCGAEGYDGGEKARAILPDGIPPYESDENELVSADRSGA